MKSKNPAAVALGKLGGSKTSSAKARSSRRNGRNGGLTSEQAKEIWRLRRMKAHRA